MVLESMDGDPAVLYAGDVFTATGHYGSTMYDPVFGGEHLKLTICAACLTGMPRPRRRFPDTAGNRRCQV